MATRPDDAKPAAGQRGRARTGGKAAADVTVTPDAGVLKLKDLVEQVAASSGLKKKDVKAVVEAALAVMGTALSAGRDLHLPPLGKARVGRQKGQAGSGDALLVVKLKRGGAVTKDENSGEKDVSEGVAATGE